MIRGAVWMILVGALANTGLADGAVVERARIATPDGERTYLLVRPDSTSRDAMPLVLVLHGHGGSAAGALGRLGQSFPLERWITIVDREKILVAALDGAVGRDGQQGWNDCRRDAAWTPQTNDVAFVHDVIERLVREFGADTTRLYAMGMSVGGMMAFRLGLELEPPLRAFATMGASMAEGSLCSAPRGAVSVLVIHGTADPLVPYSGGEISPRRPGGGHTIGVEQAVAFWCDVDSIRGEPEVESIQHRHLGGDPTRSVRFLYPGGAHGTRVEFIRVQDGGHAAPSIACPSSEAATRRFGPQSHDFECVEEAWAFFREAGAR